MWVLLLNDMRSPNIENLSIVGRAETREQIEQFLASEKVDGYNDGRWGKSYRAGGPLEWFNPPWDFESHKHFVNVGTIDDAIRNAAMTWERQIMSLPVLTAA